MSYSLQEIAEHNSAKWVLFGQRLNRFTSYLTLHERSCWVVIKNKVYDVTEFLSVSHFVQLVCENWGLFLVGTSRRCRYNLEVCWKGRYCSLWAHSPSGRVREEPSSREASRRVGLARNREAQKSCWEPNQDSRWNASRGCIEAETTVIPNPKSSRDGGQ